MSNSNASSTSNASGLEAAVDLGFRTAYRVAHRMLRAYWKIRKPNTHGALIAVWHEGRLLLVKNSYRRFYTLPGGYVRSGESAAEAARRELIEEVDLRLSLDQLREVYSRTHQFENRYDKVTIVEVEVHEPPRFDVDNREVVWASFEPPDAILRRPIVPHLAEYLRERGH